MIYSLNYRIINWIFIKYKEIDLLNFILWVIPHRHNTWPIYDITLGLVFCLANLEVDNSNKYLIAI